MAEVQTTNLSGELTQRFVEFVMMHAQNAALFLGQIPNPQTGQGEVNLQLAKMFIDQLAMVQEKTRGNLTNEETTVLRNALSNLQMAFVEVSQAQKAGGEVQPDLKPETPSSTSATVDDQQPATPAPPIGSPESESKKKFTKSYGT